MGRSGVTLRDATLGDVPVLVELWADVLRKGEPHQLAADVTAIVDGTADAVESRVVVAEVDGRVAGAVLLKLAPMTAINLESTVHVVAPHVFPELRRQGVGRALMDAAVSFAEDRGIGHLRSGSLSMSRDASRFMARLGFGPLSADPRRPPSDRPGAGGSARPAAARAGRGPGLTAPVSRA